MLRALTYEQLITYYEGIVGVKKPNGKTKPVRQRKVSASTIQDTYMEIIARVEKAQKDVNAFEVGMRVMVTPVTVALDFRVPEEAYIVDVMKDGCTIRFLDGRMQDLLREKCRPVNPLGISPLGRR